MNNIEEIKQNENTEEIEKAIEYAQSQKDEKSNFVENLKMALQVGKICTEEINLSNYSLVVCILYFTIDQQDINLDEIEEKFGKRISNILIGLIKSPDIQTNKLNVQSENFIKLLLTISPDINSILIQLAEQLWRLRITKNTDIDVQKNTALIVSQLYAPIAHRLGLYAIKTEMEDLSMKYLHNEAYKEIALKLEQTKNNREAYIKSFIEPISEELKKQHIKCEIKGRPKSISSIWKKIKTQNVDFEEVYDKFAIRVIIDSKNRNEKTECWRVYSIITDWYTPNPKRLRDWISSPKISGYESLHTTVMGPEQKWVEVQIRTERMDEIAEKGHAAHWKYKEKKEGSGSDWLAEIRKSLEQTDNAGTDKEHDENKAMLYTDEIFLFTPKGDLKKAKIGHTVLDFAFSIHTNVGETCTGAMINDKIVPIKYVLKNGDQIKILTSKTQQPRHEWLEIAQSSRTKNKIKKALKLINYRESEIGKDSVKHKLSQLKIEFNDINLKKLCKYYKVKDYIDLYQAVGIGKIDVNKLKLAFAKDINAEDKPNNEQSKPDIQAVEKTIHSQDCLVIENMLDKIDYQMANCCNPIPGDNIFGFVTVSKGIRVHKTNCPNAKDMTLRYPYRIIKAIWKQNVEFNNFIAKLKILGSDNVGITSEIMQVIGNQFKLNIHSINTKSKKNNMFEAYISFGVNSKKQLQDLITRLQRIKDITEVVRVNL